MGVASFLIKDYPNGSIIMFILASIFLVMFLLGLYYDFKDARQKEKERRKEEVRKALREAAKSLSPTGTEYTEEQLDTWMKGI